MADSVDQIARDEARRAVSGLEVHEQVCAERWRESTEKMSELSLAIKKLNDRLWAAGVGIIGGLLALVATLILHNTFR